MEVHVRKLILSFLCGAVLLFSGSAFAAVPVQDIYLTGSRTTPEASGVNATGGYIEENGGFKIAWEIWFDGSYWNYQYTLTDKDGSTIHPDVSHWIVEISPEIPLDEITDFIFNANATIQTPGKGVWGADPNFPNTTQAGENSGNPNLGTDLIGVKLDTGSQAVGGVYFFQSVEPPVWGDFYIK